VDVAGVRVHAPLVDWLSAGGARAWGRGRGSVRVGGAHLGERELLLSVQDGGTEAVRLRVWDAATGAVVHDSEPGAPDGAPPAERLDCGHVRVRRLR
jgi:hypothetical protein